MARLLGSLEMVNGSSRWDDGVSVRNIGGWTCSHQKFAKEIDAPHAVMPAKAGFQKDFDFPGFRVAPAIASLPGMTPSCPADSLLKSFR